VKPPSEHPDGGFVVQVLGQTATFVDSGRGVKRRRAHAVNVAAIPTTTPVSISRAVKTIVSSSAYESGVGRIPSHTRFIAEEAASISGGSGDVHHLGLFVYLGLALTGGVGTVVVLI
jgi:hypothetical protein